MQAFFSLLKQFWPHILFLTLNSVIVAANIIFPRFIDKPEISIISADGLTDESETKLSNTLSFVVGEVIENTEQGDSFYADKRCFYALREKQLVPNSCRKLAIATADKIIDAAKSERLRKLNAIDNIETYNREELLKALESDNPYYYRSALYTEIFFNFLAVDTFASPEISNQIKESLLVAASGLVNKEYSYVETFELFKAQLEIGNGELVRSGNMAFRVIISNAGYADDVIYPEAKLEIGGEIVNLIQVSATTINEPTLNSGNAFSVVEDGKIVVLYFVVEPALNTEKANKLVGDIARQGTPIQFRLLLKTNSGEVSTESLLSVDSISFELEFGK